MFIVSIISDQDIYSLKPEWQTLTDQDPASGIFLIWE